MSDIIHLLPDSVANQIAAGEVIQRPASVVKELMENAIDAGADYVQLIVKDAGKTLIQVIDNGSGMSETDARLCFERHATSKINDAKDLFSIRTMGFRGEALASIASISQLELKTKSENDALGTQIIIEGSDIKNQEVCQFQKGTSISVKNLFYNVPARRNFLKNDAQEIHHINEEFYRVALINHNVAFSLYYNDKLTIKLEKSNLKQRVVNVFGKNYNEKLIPVEQSTQLVNISGYIGKPEFAKKTRGEQYFYVNNRFFKHPYFHHAIENAYNELIPEKSYPLYLIHFEINTEKIDVNIHPTKTEIKFQDERTIYALLRSAIKHGLGKNNIVPSLDFEVEQSFTLNPPDENKIIYPPSIKVDPNFNPFDKKNEKKSLAPEYIHAIEKGNNQDWIKLFENQKKNDIYSNKELTTSIDKENYIEITEENKNTGLLYNSFQIHNKYIITPIKSGLVIIDQQRAHERILYENYLKLVDKKTSYSQQQLFPQTVVFNEKDVILLNEIKNELNDMGFEINEFGKNTFIINSIPCDMVNTNIQNIIEEIL